MSAAVGGNTQEDVASLEIVDYIVGRSPSRQPPSSSPSARTPPSPTGATTAGASVPFAATDLAFSSSDPIVATVDANRTVTAVAEGLAIITATANSNGTTVTNTLGVMVPYASQTLPAGWALRNMGAAPVGQ